MKLPQSRLLPLTAVALGGVLAVNALSGAVALPELLSGRAAKAEEGKAKDGKATEAPAAAAKPTGLAALPKAAPACVTPVADLAVQAGLTPAELQLLQSLQSRRGQLEGREKELDDQLQLLAAAEAKVDAKLRNLAAARGQVDLLKADIQKLVGQTDAQTDAETMRMVTVFSSMKPKDAALRFTVLDDSVRLPIAAKMKERTLGAIMSQMAPADSKELTEKLAARFASARTKADKLIAANPALAAAPAAPGGAPATTPPTKS